VPSSITALALDHDAERLIVGYGSGEVAGACLCNTAGRLEVNWKLDIRAWVGRTAPSKQDCRVTSGPVQCMSLATGGPPSLVVTRQPGRLTDRVATHPEKRGRRRAE
jgi:hypothetical protein